MVPPDELFSSVDLLEHFPHTLNVVVIEEPYRGIFLIFFERYYNKSVSAVFRSSECCSPAKLFDTLTLLPSF